MDSNIKGVFKNDDLVLIMRPNFDGKEWNGTVDLNMMCMPSDKLSEDALDELSYLMQATITCFHLLNTDTDFAERVSQEMARMVESGELQLSDPSDYSNVIDLTEWTQTRGNA